MARQSNIVMTTNSTATSTHVVKFGDIQLLNNILLVAIRSTKTRYSSAPPIVFRLPPIPNSHCCQVAAWRNYISNVALPQDFPALVLPNGSPLTATTLLKALRLVSHAIFNTDRNIAYIRHNMPNIYASLNICISYHIYLYII